jgi:hypothetical protein
MYPLSWDETEEVKKKLWRVSYVINTADSNQNIGAFTDRKRENALKVFLQYYFSIGHY